MAAMGGVGLQQADLIDRRRQRARCDLAMYRRGAVAEFRRPDGVLEAACLTDLMNDGLSAVYSFFRASPGNSLGTYMILWLVQEAKRVGLPYVYLGYWIGESEKMAYKSRFSPLEAFGPGGWRRMVL